jgi:hypothetical protein
LGANSNLFHQGFAQEVDDPKLIKAALAKPGIMLKRPVGTSEAISRASASTDQRPAERARAAGTEAGQTNKEKAGALSSRKRQSRS